MHRLYSHTGSEYIYTVFLCQKVLRTLNGTCGVCDEYVTQESTLYNLSMFLMYFSIGTVSVAMTHLCNHSLFTFIS